MKKVLFIMGTNPHTRAYYGWQDQDTALWGLKEGYKNTSGDLVSIAIERGLRGDNKTLDTYIFPIMHGYRHSLEISLKLIFRRMYGKMLLGHELDALWKEVKEKVIDILETEDFLNEVRPLKKKFYKFTVSDIDFTEIESLIYELHNADKKSDVWRYLIDKKGKLYFTSSVYIDYENLKTVFNHLYDVLEFIYTIINEYLSSDPV